jgi:hypothetical protein
MSTPTLPQKGLTDEALKQALRRTPAEAAEEANDCLGNVRDDFGDIQGIVRKALAKLAGVEGEQIEELRDALDNAYEHLDQADSALSDAEYAAEAIEDDE